MPIESTLIAKIVCSSSVVCGAGAAGIVYREEIGEQFQNIFGKKINEEKNVATSKTDSYLIVVKTDSVITNTENLHNTVNNITTKNFTCKFEDKFDDACDIYKLPPITDNKLNGLKEIKESNTNPISTEIKQNTYFKLKIKKELIENSKFDGNETVEFIKKGTTPTSLATFSILYKLDENTVKGKTNLLIGQSKGTTDKTIDSSTSKCKLSNLTGDTAIGCTIYKFTSQPADSMYKQLIFSTSTLSTPVDKNDISENSFYVIDLGNTKKHDISTFTDETVIVYETNESENAKIVEFKLIAPLAINSNFATEKTSLLLSN